jgi:hypothetical protein
MYSDTDKLDFYRLLTYFPWKLMKEHQKHFSDIPE